MADNNKVLVVEDNDFVRMQIVTFLRAAEYEVFEAMEGGAALDQFDAHPDLAVAIVDVRMEPMGGLEFVKALRGRDIDMPVILATGDQTPDLLEQSGKWGVSAVLMKPVQKERLVKMVERTIQHTRRGE